MNRFAGFLRHVVAFAVLFAMGCTGHGEYRIYWSFSDGEVTGSDACSRRGVEKITVWILNLEDGTGRVDSYPCNLGGTGKHSLTEGTYYVQIQAFGPSGAAFTDPQTGEPALLETISELKIVDRDAVTEETVVLTPNPACADLIDNDGDGLADEADPGCRDKNGEYDPSQTSELDTNAPGTLTVTWQIADGEPCTEVQPDGATAVSVMVDDLEIGLYPCSEGTGAIPLSSGPHQVALRLLGPGGTELATTPSQTATLVQDLGTTLDFDFSLADFDPPQTGALRFRISWISAGQTCTDASPVVAEQSLWLQDADGVTLDATTLSGIRVSGDASSVGACIDASEVQGLTAFVPAGDYTLTVTGFEPGGAACWETTVNTISVGIGPNDPIDVLVPQSDATGVCAP